MDNTIIMLSLIFFLLLSFIRTTTSLGSFTSLALNQSLQDGETLVSSGGTFEVGFFSPGNSTNRYLGIWYKNVSPLTVIWVANREIPLESNSGVLKLNQNGALVILSGTNSTIWSSFNNTPGKSSNPIAQVLDSGNLVLKNTETKERNDFLWQSFDYPGDTFVPGGMKIGWDLVTRKEYFLSSWKSDDDPSEGEYFLRIVTKGYPQFFTFKGSKKIFRGGSWNGVGFSGYPTHQLSQYRQRFLLNDKQVFLECDILDKSIVSIYKLRASGLGQTYAWTNQSNTRNVISTGVQDECERFALCGANSVCILDGNLPTCECLKGYVPKFPEQWNISYWSNGCVARNVKSDCVNGSSSDGFWKYTEMKLPDTSFSWFSEILSLEDCRNKCLENCSCTSYSNLYVLDGGSGCLLWFDDMVDMRRFTQGGQDLYIRVPASELDNGRRKKMMLIIGITVGGIIFGLTCACALILRKRGVARLIYRKHYESILKKEEIYLPTFDFSVIVKATQNFSSCNKLGEGGFGPVYKGTLTNGQELAVKRLSKNSGQGLEEFKNEVVLIAKLQHRNLVKLLGCCIEEEDIMLIYEYMPNKSLDNFIFDETRRHLLEWPKRFNIICGIARGLLYLHQDSRLRIIHRDLKTSNILLDANLDPKISDFGLARTLLGDQIEANTTKVAGTYGYMPPEYAVRGHFSTKSDVFSYGVIVLEIAWRLWSEGRQLELLDEALGERFTPSEATKCIQVGLLCVQQRPEDRPNMSSVVLMLNGEKLLPNPKVPAFYIERDTIPESDALLENCMSRNEVSITVLEAR
ncbi:G-type lectin S-receptor-like serine/threonine-protein kinase At4g27290 isoform X2 [Arachis stenosperma]|uniref:G-type lectin S-receptor-like serine/threonine-protein kinase At4g27290 isoform X2 n=1 Tax=Arachis stenosperma TaxID=217475 RepID=UPI0025AC8F3D|nr:G-type lectin S-receptor-like serine/threonine-protein kinase At4g27290 isoform X2 [Arachis stenosperma]